MLEPFLGGDMGKSNCWEFMKCGRQPGGEKTDELGVCPASVESRTDGMNSGKMGGRSCWVISGTFCNGEVQGEFASKMLTCIECKFYRKVTHEEGLNFQSAKKILDKLK